VQLQMVPFVSGAGENLFPPPAGHASLNKMKELYAEWEITAVASRSAFRQQGRPSCILRILGAFL